MSPGKPSARDDAGSPTSPQSDDRVTGSATDLDFTEEDWGAAALELLLEEDLESFQASPGAVDRSDWQLLTYSATPRDHDEELLPNGISISAKVVSWRGCLSQTWYARPKHSGQSARRVSPAL